MNNISKPLCVSIVRIEISDLREPIFRKSDMTDVSKLEPLNVLLKLPCK